MARHGKPGCRYGARTMGKSQIFWKLNGTVKEAQKGEVSLRGQAVSRIWVMNLSADGISWKWNAEIQGGLHLCYLFRFCLHDGNCWVHGFARVPKAGLKAPIFKRLKEYEAANEMDKSWSKR